MPERRRVPCDNTLYKSRLLTYFLLLNSMLVNGPFAGALFLQPVRRRWPCPEHIMAKWAGPSNAENNPNTNPNIYTPT